MRAAVALLTLLTGCSAISDALEQKKADEIRAKYRAETAACEAKYPTGNLSTLKPHLACIQAAENATLRPIHPQPDLLDLQQTQHMAIVTRVERREISPEEGAAAMAKVNSEVQSEIQRRGNAGRMADAQESLANAAYRSTACIRSGRAVFCN